MFVDLKALYSHRESLIKFARDAGNALATFELLTVLCALTA